jgi:hypothetical protein
MHSSKLRRDYDLLLQAPFPSGSAIDELDAMHAELAYAEGYSDWLPGLWQISG